MRAIPVESYFGGSQLLLLLSSRTPPLPLRSLRALWNDVRLGVRPGLERVRVLILRIRSDPGVSLRTGTDRASMRGSRGYVGSGPCPGRC